MAGTGDTPTEAPLPENPSHDPQPNPVAVKSAIPWLQALGLVAMCFALFIDSQTADWNPPREFYLLCGLVLVGAGPRELVDMLAIWRKPK